MTKINSCLCAQRYFIIIEILKTHIQNFVFTLLRVAQRLCAVFSLIPVVVGNRWFSGEPCLMHNR